MRINREKDYINRLCDILDYKQVTYQTKLEEIDHKKEIKDILSKYPNSPIRGLVELDNEQLLVLLSYFTDDECNENELDIKKYWITEAENNESLKETSRYKESIKLFEHLGDKLQEYLESIKGLNVSYDDTAKMLELVESLQNSIQNKKPIYDLSKYYPILKPSETLVEEDIYNFLVALAMFNIKNMNNKERNTASIKLTKDMKSFLTSLINDRMKELENEKVKCVIVNDKLINLSNFIDKIENNYDALLDAYPKEIKNVMSSMWDQNIINSNIEKLTIPMTVAKGRKQGLKLDYEQEEINIIQNFIKLLKKEEARISEKEINDKKEREDKLVEEIDVLQATLNKIEEKDKSFFEITDFENVLNLVKGKGKDFDFTKNVVVVMNALNFKYDNAEEEPEVEEHIIAPEVEEAELGEKEPVIEDLVEEPVEEEEEESTAAKVEKIFFDHGFNFTNFPSRLVKKIVSNIPLDKLEEMANYIDSKEELSFIKEYTYSDIGEEGIAKRIHDIKCSQLYYIFAYSSPAIFDSLLAIGRENEISFKAICSVPRVFASKQSDDYGTYENFVNNVRYLKENYPNALRKYVKSSPYVLGTDYILLKKNIELTENYGMNIEEDKRGAFPSPRALMTRSFEYVVDRYIEAHEYDYIERFRNQIETNAAVALRLRYKQLKGLDFRNNEFYSFNHNFEKLKPYLKDLSIENIPVGINDEAIKWLDEINEEKDKDKSHVQYVLEGIYISRLKVLKYYSTLLINGYENKKEALFYSLIKDSFLTKDEYDKLNKLVKKGGE